MTSDLKLLAKYPFLKKAKDYVMSLNLTLSDIQNHPIYSGSFELGRQRVVNALNNNLVIDMSDKISQELAILSFVVARIIVNLTDNRSIIRRYARSESMYAYKFLKSETDDIIELIKEDLNIRIVNGRIHFIDYIRLTTDLVREEPKWKLINRRVNKGQVELKDTDSLILLREAIKERIMSPVNVSGIPDNFREVANMINNKFSRKPSRMDINELDIKALPPCISELLVSLESGNISHNGMFVLGTCLLALGLSVDDVIKIFSRYPEFNEEKTRYQIEFLAGKKSKTRYSCPTCAKIRAYGLCVSDCNVKHPLIYYKNQTTAVQS